MLNIKRLSQSDCAIFPLVLKAKWYGMIIYGEKHEEYREYKDFWIKRICKFWNNTRDEDIFRKEPLTKIVAFSRGYRKADLFFIIDGIETREESIHPDWGEPSGKHFVIRLGERIQLEEV